MEHLLEIDQLKTYYFTDCGIVKAVDGALFRSKKGSASE
jgi:ABC-type dipeptide/oligopeptide/nickel transport system ATPase component